MPSPSRLSAVAVLLMASCVCARSQGPESSPPAESAAQPASAAAADPAAQPDKRMFGVLPNYRTVEDDGAVAPLSTRRKFYIASRDSFDFPIYFIASALAGLSQLEDSNPSLGEGMKGYAKRFAFGCADQMIGNMMTEGVMPALLHEDPRYYRRGTGRKLGRAFYAFTRVLVTHTDAGGVRFNFSEVVGNSVAVAVSNAYYPDSRTASLNLKKLSLQIGTDGVSNVLKEFWPDIKRKLHHGPTALAQATSVQH